MTEEIHQPTIEELKAKAYKPMQDATELHPFDNPEMVYEHTNKWNTVAVVSDGSRVLGLGDIGPKAGMPVMEGKSLLYK